MPQSSRPLAGPSDVAMDPSSECVSEPVCDLEQAIRTVYAAIEMGNHDALGELFHPTAVYRRPGAPPLLGRDRIIEFYRAIRSMKTSHIMVERVISQGHTAVAIGLVEGRGLAGERVHEQFADVYEFDSGLVTARTTYFYRHGF